MAKYLDSVGLTHLVSKLKSDVIPNVKVKNAAAADKANSVPASGITGVIDISHIPQGALERVVTVTDDAARYKLTTSQVQLGDTVKVTSSGRMYIVIDESKLSSAAGYMEYSAGTAASVPWSGVTGKPSTFAPSAHNHTASVKIGKADSRTVSTSAKLSLSVADIIGTPATSGSGNAVTAIAVSGDTITVTKGATFAVASEEKKITDALSQRLDTLEDFTGASGAGGLADRLATAGYDIVPFNGFLTAAPTLSQTSLAGDAPGLVIQGTTASDGTVTVAGIYAFVQAANSSAKTYYANWGDFLKATSDATGTPKKSVYLHKIYLDTTTGKAYYASSTSTLKQIDCGDKALTNTEIDAAVSAA